MPVDTQPDFKPPAPEKIKSAGVKSKETKPASEFLLTVRQKVEGILDRWKGGSHAQEVLQDLSSVEIPEEKYSQIVKTPKNNLDDDTISIFDPDYSQKIKDFDEVQRLSEKIKSEATKDSESQPANETLFPNRPSLYDQHHKTYDQECKTVTGKITRLKDITALKLAGVKKATYTYDGLRSRGITRDQIMKNDTGEFPRISRTLRTTEGIKEYQKKYFYTDLPKNIDRLYSIGEFDLGLFSSDEEFSHTEAKASILSHQTDEQFQQIRDKINDFSFLSNSNTFRFFNKKELPSDTFDALSYLKKEYFSDPQNETKLDSFLSKQYWSKDRVFDSLIQENYHDGITDLVKTLISSGVNDGKKIDMTPELLKFSKENESNILRCLSILETRDQQKFLVDRTSRYDYSNKETDLINRYFDSNLQPNFQFYKDFITKFEDISQKVTIPNEILNSIQDRDTKDFYQFLSNLSDGQIQHYILSYIDKTNYSPGMIFDEGKLIEEPYNLLRDSLNDPNIMKKPIKVDQIKDFVTSKSDQRDISVGSTISNIYLRRFFLNQEPEERNKYLDQNNELTSHFYEKYLITSWETSNKIDSLKTELTPEKITTFSPQDQKLWRIALSFAKTNDTDFPAFIIRNRHQIDLLFNSESKPTSLFLKKIISETSSREYYEYVISNLTPDLISTFSPEDQLFWSRVLGFKRISPDILKIIVDKCSQTDLYFNDNNQPTSFFFESLIKDSRFQSLAYDFRFLISNLTPELTNTFSSEDQKFWSSIISLNNKDKVIVNWIMSAKDNHKIDLYFNNNNQPTAFFFKDLIQTTSGSHDNSVIFEILTSLSPELLSTFSQKDQELFSFILGLEYKNKSEIIKFLFANGEDPNRYIENNALNLLFYKDFANQNPSSFIDSFNKEDWRLAFGNEAVDELLNALPKSSDEKRNAFTHNEYDRTTQFFQFLIRSQDSGFKLDSTNIKIATDYIKNYGLSRSLLFYSYFQKISLYEQGLTTTLPVEIMESRIYSREDLKREIRSTQKKCFGVKPLTDINNLSPFQLSLLSIATGHSVNRWTRIPIETITSDFSRDLANGNIAPISPEFRPESVNSSSIKVETDQNFSETKNLALIKQEILSSIDHKDNIDLEKSDLLNMLSPKITSLSEKIQTIPENKRQFIQKQIDAYKQQVDLVSSSDSIDVLLSNLITFNINLGESQDQFNSILRRLVFKKVFLKHQESPHWQEDIKYSLEKDDTVSAVNNVLNLLNNTIKDHVLNFESKNQDGYWTEPTFEAMKKYSSVFKKNLSLPTFINELQSLKETFVVTQLDVNQTVKLVPDRGLVGEMSGYMADVCYTKVYPLLKQYPGLVPYKFVSNPESENPEFIGSTLVFQVEDADNQPVFLIRAFDIPQEQSLNIGNFFETFVDHLTPIAKKMGVKKIITAGTSGTISNYPTTNSYVISKYVTGQKNVPLKNTFNFNGYDITNQCYLVRDIS